MVVTKIVLSLSLAIGMAALAIGLPYSQDESVKTSAPITVETFEKSIRPILVQHCTGCHGAYVQQANLRLDSPVYIRKGGPRGPVLNPTNLEKSILLEAIRYDDHNLMMPPTGRIPKSQIEIVAEWIRGGAPMPADQTKAVVTPAGPSKDWKATFASRRAHWSYLPVIRPLVPKVAMAGWSKNPIDAFVFSSLKKQGLTPSSRADKRTLIRRVTFDLTGLPPSTDEIDRFIRDTQPNAYQTVVNRLIASPAYGERWGRHWLDLMRYAESLGHEFDYTMANAFKYRDYVIRAFNNDIPYNQFLVEHLAGDTLSSPRRDPVTNVNESLLATGFYWLGEGKHSPTDVRQEQADRIDNQIDVIGKSMLGITVACARCHDHKFDPIPTRDYYGLYGMLKSSRYEQLIVNDAAFTGVLNDYNAVQQRIDRKQLAIELADSLNALPDEALSVASRSASLSPLEPLVNLNRWKSTGIAYPRLAAPGDLLLTGNAAQPIRGFVAGSTVHSGITPLQFEGVMRSPTFTLEKRYLHVRVAGRRSKVNLMVDNFIMIQGPIFDGVELNLDTDQYQWRTIDTQFWPKREAYFDVMDSPMPSVTQGAPLDRTVDGWAAFDGYVLSDSPSAPKDKINPLTTQTASVVRAQLVTLARNFGTGAPFSASDVAGLAVLDQLARGGRLSVPSLEPIAQQLSAIEARTPTADRSPGMTDGALGTDEKVFIRGNHRALGEVAPRLQLAVTFTENKKLQPAAGSGRAEFAKLITDPSHPLTARVAVNRLWHHHFGAGIVRSVDDFGVNGERPSHPQLLDWLASEFVRTGWSFKKMHARIVMSETYCQRSDARPVQALKVDPNNRLLWKFPVRRLEAEAIRDNLLAVSGTLNTKMYGPSIFINLDPGTDGRGLPPSGPLDGNGRRTLYMGVRRNFMSTFFQAFDMPTPFTCIGRRTTSNVPAQALALMNSPFVREMANRWADVLMKVPSGTRLDVAYTSAYGRLPTASERVLADEFLGASKDDVTVWRDLCHVMFNVKEFIFIR